MMDLEQILKNFLDDRKRLKAFPAKRKMKVYALFYLAGKFEQGIRYTEPEVNDLLDRWHIFHDPATLRRELYNGHFLNREPNGSLYWLEEKQPSMEEFL